MTEKIIIRQNKRYAIEFWAVDPNQPESSDYERVSGLHEVTPYGMMLFSLAGCTAQVVLSYAAHHGISLEEVEIRAVYERSFVEDCVDCENINRYEEKITEEIAFFGELKEDEPAKLFKIAHQCPIEKMYKQGVPIDVKKVDSSIIEKNGE